jgi:hypothetical protein
VRYENKIKDYNFGCLIRTDAREEYSQSNSIFGEDSAARNARYLTSDTLNSVTRIQVGPVFSCSTYPMTQLCLSSTRLRFVAPFSLERTTPADYVSNQISRNKLGLNDSIYERANVGAVKDGNPEKQVAETKESS